MAAQTFNNQVFLRSSGAKGQYYVKYIGTNKPLTVTDPADQNTNDNTTIIGDIANDHYTTLNTYGNSFNLTYVGRSADGQGIVGKGLDKNNNPFYYITTNGNNKYSVYQTVSFTNISTQPYALCFCSGTSILTTHGEIAVERLVAGDVALTVSGAARPIVWIGRRELGADEPMAPSQWPVRVRAGAFGRSAPSRDLYLSPGHPVLVGSDDEGRGGFLVPVMCLINGTTIDRVERDSVVYWHVELDEHDIVLADGLPVESYLDLGCRAFFGSESNDRLQDPDLMFVEMPGRCRPVAIDGPIIEGARWRLDSAFAGELTEHCAWSVPVGMF